MGSQNGEDGKMKEQCKFSTGFLYYGLGVVVASITYSINKPRPIDMMVVAIVWSAILLGIVLWKVGYHYGRKEK